MGIQRFPEIESNSGESESGGGAENLAGWSSTYQATSSSSYYTFATRSLKAGKKYVVKWELPFDTNNTSPSYIDLLFKTATSVSNQTALSMTLSEAGGLLEVRTGTASLDAINTTQTIPTDDGFISGSMYVDLSGEESDVDFTIEGRVGSGSLVIRRYTITAIEVAE